MGSDDYEAVEKTEGYTPSNQVELEANSNKEEPFSLEPTELWSPTTPASQRNAHLKPFLDHDTAENSQHNEAVKMSQQQQQQQQEYSLREQEQQNLWYHQQQQSLAGRQHLQQSNPFQGPLPSMGLQTSLPLSEDQQQLMQRYQQMLASCPPSMLADFHAQLSSKHGFQVNPLYRVSPQDYHGNNFTSSDRPVVAPKQHVPFKKQGFSRLAESIEDLGSDEEPVRDLRREVDVYDLSEDDLAN